MQQELGVSQPRNIMCRTRKRSSWFVGRFFFATVGSWNKKACCQMVRRHHANQIMWAQHCCRGASSADFEGFLPRSSSVRCAEEIRETFCSACLRDFSATCTLAEVCGTSVMVVRPGSVDRASGFYVRHRSNPSVSSRVVAGKGPVRAAMVRLIVWGWALLFFIFCSRR